MSPRRNRGNKPGSEAPRGLGVESTQLAPDGEWHVRTVSGAAATKTYRCPGCDQEIRPGVPHVVAWPADVGSPEDRRHWHRPCWENRLSRRPRRK
jgi:hypothetical protein